MRGMKGRMRENAFFYWDFLGIPVFANNFMGSKVRLNSILEMYHCMEDCFCLGKQSRDRVALCLMCLLTSHSTFNSSQNVPVRAGLFWRFPSMPVPKLQSGYQAHTHTNTGRGTPGLLLSEPRETFILLFSSAQHSRAQAAFIRGCQSCPSSSLPSLFVWEVHAPPETPWWERDQKLDFGE